MRKTLSNAAVLGATRTIDHVLATTERLPGGPIQVPLARTLRTLLPLARDVDEAKTAIIERFAETDGDGKPTGAPVEGTPGAVQYTLTDPAAAQAEMNELLSAEVEVELYPPDLDRLGDTTLDAGDLLALLDLFEPAVSLGL